ncbi:MAG: hypothetical protein ACP5FH_08270 [Terracidiphilus sp.]
MRRLGAWALHGRTPEMAGFLPLESGSFSVPKSGIFRFQHRAISFFPAQPHLFYSSPKLGNKTVSIGTGEETDVRGFGCERAQQCGFSTTTIFTSFAGGTRRFALGILVVLTLAAWLGMTAPACAQFTVAPAISTVAGNGSRTSFGDGGLAVNAGILEFAHK